MLTSKPIETTVTDSSAGVMLITWTLNLIRPMKYCWYLKGKSPVFNNSITITNFKTCLNLVCGVEVRHSYTHHFIMYMWHTDAQMDEYLNLIRSDQNKSPRHTAATVTFITLFICITLLPCLHSFHLILNCEAHCKLCFITSFIDQQRYLNCYHHQMSA